MDADAIVNVGVPLVTEILSIAREIRERNKGAEPSPEEVATELHARVAARVKRIEEWEG
jgi:hypothetical protein